MNQSTSRVTCRELIVWLLWIKLKGLLTLIKAITKKRGGNIDNSESHSRLVRVGAIQGIEDALLHFGGDPDAVFAE